MQAVTAGALKHCPVEFSSDAACCVVLASAGYPESYQKGFEITIPAEITDHVYVAGASLKDGKLATSGGRVLGVTAVADTLKEALKDSYDMVSQIHFDNAYYRHDIGKRALEAE